MIKALIVDDEQPAARALAVLLDRHCPQITLVATCTDPREALATIREVQPQLLFLDIEMPHMNGFELLEKLVPLSFGVIFITSYDQYAIKAIKFSASDYLLKPVDAGELKTAVQNFVNRSSSLLPQQLDILFSRLHQLQTVTGRIALPTMDGLQIIPVVDIIFCSSSSNYTILTIRGRQKLTVSRSLKEIEEMLEEYNFLRIHHSYLVNLAEVKKYIRGEGGSVLMSDGSSVDVSRAKKDLLLQKLQPGK